VCDSDLLIAKYSQAQQSTRVTVQLGYPLGRLNCTGRKRGGTLGAAGVLLLLLVVLLLQRLVELERMLPGAAVAVAVAAAARQRVASLCWSHVMHDCCSLLSAGLVSLPGAQGHVFRWCSGGCLVCALMPLRAAFSRARGLPGRCACSVSAVDVARSRGLGADPQPMLDAQPVARNGI
jgi:hypothetical protein